MITTMTMVMFIMIMTTILPYNVYVFITMIMLMIHDDAAALGTFLRFLIHHAAPTC